MKTKNRLLKNFTLGMSIFALSVSCTTMMGCAENNNQNSSADTGSGPVTASPEMGADTLSNRHIETTATDTTRR